VYQDLQNQSSSSKQRSVGLSITHGELQCGPAVKLDGQKAQIHSEWIMFEKVSSTCLRVRHQLSRLQTARGKSIFDYHCAPVML
jgi:hypothetical protein